MMSIHIMVLDPQMGITVSKHQMYDKQTKHQPPEGDSALVQTKAVARCPPIDEHHHHQHHRHYHQNHHYCYDDNHSVPGRRVYYCSVSRDKEGEPRKEEQAEFHFPSRHQPLWIRV